MKIIHVPIHIMEYYAAVKVKVKTLKGLHAKIIIK